MTYDGSDSPVRKWFEGDDLLSIRLSVVGLDGVATALDSWEKSRGEVEIREASEQAASRHCNVFGGSQAYVLQALGAKDGVLASYPFRLSAEALPGVGVLASEPANVGGITAQLMRHQEAIMSSTVLAWDKLSKASDRMIDRADKRAAKAENAYYRFAELHHEMIEHTEERKAEGKRQDRLMDIKADSAKKLTALAPVILESIVKKIAPEGLDRASAHTARTFFESLNQDQLNRVLAAVDTEQQQIIIHLLKRLAADEEGVSGESDEGSDAPH